VNVRALAFIFVYAGSNPMKRLRRSTPLRWQTESVLSALVQCFVEGGFLGITRHIRRRSDSGPEIRRSAGPRRTHRAALDGPSGAECALALRRLAATIGVQSDVSIRECERCRAAVQRPDPPADRLRKDLGPRGTSGVPVADLRDLDAG
jgi:hypothetical protein